MAMWKERSGAPGLSDCGTPSCGQLRWECDDAGGLGFPGFASHPYLCLINAPFRLADFVRR